MVNNSAPLVSAGRPYKYDNMINNNLQLIFMEQFIKIIYLKLLIFKIIVLVKI